MKVKEVYQGVSDFLLPILLNTQFINIVERETDDGKNHCANFFIKQVFSHVSHRFEFYRK